MDTRYLVWVLGLALLAALPAFAGFTSPGWEIAEITGFAGLLGCLVLCGSPVRPRESRPPVLLSLGRHQALGGVVLGLATLHVVAAAVADHAVLEYLKPTLPLYQLAGIAALMLLLFLVAASMERWRHRLWRSHRNFQALHIALGCLLLVLLAAHVVAANRYTGGYGRRILFLAVAAGGMALLLKRRRGATMAAQQGGVLRGGASVPEGAPVRGFAFGRHSTLVVCIIVAAMLGLAPLVLGRADVALREPLLRRPLDLPLDFDHRKHVAVNCLTCHHNYADGRGFDGCIHCHAGPRPDLKIGVEARFHAFCLNCHRNPEPTFPRHGPVSGCSTCHRVGAEQTPGHP